MEHKKKIGIMGGTFNPIHYGHIEMAKKAYEQFQLDKVLFMPSGNSYLKKNVLDVKHRVAMVELAIAEYDYFELSLVEVERQGNTYTYETLRDLTQLHPDTDYYFILGADSLMYLEHWKNPEVIFSLSTILCAVRDDYDMGRLIEKISWLKENKNANIEIINMPKIDISSTLIREKAATHCSVSQYVPAIVEDYIQKEHLYEKD